MKRGLILQYSKQMPNLFHSLQTSVEAQGLDRPGELSAHKEESHQCEVGHVLTAGALVNK